MEGSLRQDATAIKQGLLNIVTYTEKQIYTNRHELELGMHKEI